MDRPVTRQIRSQCVPGKRISGKRVSGEPGGVSPGILKSIANENSSLKNPGANATRLTGKQNPGANAARLTGKPGVAAMQSAVLLFAFCGLTFLSILIECRCFAGEPPSQFGPSPKNPPLVLRPLRNQNPQTPAAAITRNSSDVRNVSHAPDADDSSKQTVDPESNSENTGFEVSPALVALQTLETTPIDLAGAFSLIGCQNPQFLAARQRVLEASALRQLAAVQLLPTINLGSSFYSHSGVMLQPDGSLIKVNNQSLFVGAGANAIGAGTVNIPGVVWDLNVSDSYFNYLISRQVQSQRAANVTTVNNDVQRRVATAYLDLVRAASYRSIAWQARQDVAEVARITAIFERAGQGRSADANRAASELHSRDADVIDAEGQMVSASARLAALVGLDTAVRLVPTDRWAVPHSIVPEPIPLPELLTIDALLRQELAEQRADFARTLLALDASKMLPFSPNVFLYPLAAAATFGGGVAILPTLPA